MNDVVAVTGGRVVSMASGSTDVVENGVVVFDGGKIVAVGAADSVEIPSGATVVDASGQWVLPGFVEAHAHLGVHEEADGWAGNDTNEMTDPVGARFRAIDAINPADQGFADALAGGVTTAVVKPGSGSPIGGRTVALKCWGRIVDEMVIREPASVKSALGENPKRVYGEKKVTPSTRLGVAAVIRDAFSRARYYAAKRAKAEKKGLAFDHDATLETLAMVLDGTLPWCQHCHRADDIATAVRLAEEFGYRLVVNHATEGHLIADVLAQKEIPVVAGPLLTSRSKVELRHRTMASPGIMARAGVKVALTTDHPVVPINLLVLQATLAVKEGMTRDDALRSLTVNPAWMMGLDEGVGSLEVGKDADVVVWSGDPLDVMSRVTRVFLDGRDVYTWTPESGGVVADPFA